MPAAQRPALFIERRGANLMIRLRGDRDSPEYGLFSAIPSLPGNTVVLTSVGSLTSQELPHAVNRAAREAVAALPEPPPPGHRMWLALSGLGRPDTGTRPWPQRLADELGVEVLAPQGSLSLVPGGLLFAGGESGMNVWRSFRRGDTSRPWGARHPQPRWEALLPPDPVSAAGLTVESIPAGLLVRAEGAPPTPAVDRAYAVAVHPGRPRLVLGRLGEPGWTPAQIAALFSMFPPTLGAVLELVPHTPGVATAEWCTDLAIRLDREVRAASGMPLYGHDGRVHVIAHGREGDQLFRHPAAVRRYSADGTRRVLICGPPPAGWTSDGAGVHRLAGTEPAPGEPVAEVVPAGFALVPASAIGSAACSAIPVEPHRFTIAVGVPETPLPRWAPDALKSLLAGLGPDTPGRFRVLVLAKVSEDGKNRLLDAAGAEAGLVDFPDLERGAVWPSAELEPAERAAESPVPSARHRSTKVEQAEFQRRAGELYTTALGSVDAALATSPALRGATGSKPDLIAVHLYLGAGELGAIAVNSALRTGKGPALSSAHLACLTSGLRLLPVHRGVVFRPLCLPDPEKTLGGYAEGSVLAEPGFLSATGVDDLAVPGGSVEVLIWSRSGRRTDDLGTGGLPQEIVFPAQTRLKVLAVELEAAPALLLRELHPDELPASPTLDSTDEAVLSKLRRALRRRRAVPARVLEDPDQIGRLTPPLGRPWPGAESGSNPGRPAKSPLRTSPRP